MSDVNFKMDRGSFHAGSHLETEVYYSKNQPKTGEERLAAAYYLNSVAFNYDLSNPPKMDRSAFSMRKHNH